MKDEPLNEHLSQVSTVWTDLFEAHGGAAEVIGAAQRRLLERYSPAVLRFLHKVVGDPDEAWELFQEFALRLLRGAFRRADPARGRFRDYLKTALRHLIADHQKHRAGQPLLLPPEVLARSTAAPLRA